MSRSGNGFTDRSFAWFEGLRADNSTDWFDEHRDTYADHVRDPFVALLEELSVALSGSSLPLRGGSQTMFRTHRDLRFTDDPRPYNEQVSALLTRDGTKDEAGPLLYLEQLVAHRDLPKTGLLDDTVVDRCWSTPTRSRRCIDSSATTCEHPTGRCGDRRGGSTTYRRPTVRCRVGR